MRNHDFRQGLRQAGAQLLRVERCAALRGDVSEQAFVAATGIDDSTLPPHRFEPTRVSDPPTLGLDLANGAIQTIIWATGFRPDYSWLDVDVLDGKGMIRHDGGVVVDSPGMYLIGTPFLRRRKSSFMDGARADAQDLTVELAAFLDRQASPTR